MSTNSPDRLDRIEAALEATQRLTESNARSIQAFGESIATMRLTQAETFEQAQEERSELRAATIGIANLLASLDSDRPTVLRKLNAIENKVDQLLQQGNNGV